MTGSLSSLLVSEGVSWWSLMLQPGGAFASFGRRAPSPAFTICKGLDSLPARAQTPRRPRHGPNTLGRRSLRGGETFIRDRGGVNAPEASSWASAPRRSGARLDRCAAAGAALAGDRQQA